MSARLKCKSSCPYGNVYSLKLPELGMVGQGTTFEQLMGNLKTYRKANAIPIGLGFEGEVEEQICARYPNECENVNPLIPNRQQRLNYDDVIEGTAAFARLALSGKTLVDQEEANRRAAICSVCPNNADFLKPCGWLCGALKTMADQVLGSRATPYDDRLRSCQVCRCFNGIAVWFPLDIQQQGLSQLQKEQFRFAKESFSCWKAEGL